MNESIRNEIKSFLDDEGKLTQLPGKKRKKLIALYYLSEQIPVDGRYTEREFNQLLNTLHTFGDPATLRREMYDTYLIEREKDCTGYRVNPDKKPFEEWITERI